MTTDAVRNALVELVRTGTVVADASGSLRTQWTDFGIALIAARAALEAQPVQPAQAEADLGAQFTKESGGPNPYYRCKLCNESVPGIESCMREHLESNRHRAALSAAPAAGPQERVHAMTPTERAAQDREDILAERARWPDVCMDYSPDPEDDDDEEDEG